MVLEEKRGGFSLVSLSASFLLLHWLVVDVIEYLRTWHMLL